MGVENASTRPVVIVTSRVQRSSRCRVTGLPWTPMLAMCPPGRIRSPRVRRWPGTPTASMATSAPSPSVSVRMISSGSSRPLLIVTSAPTLLGGLQPAVGEIDRDHRGRAVELRSDDRRQSDRACADDGDDIARLDMTVEDADLVAGRQDVGQHQNGLVGHAVGNRIGREIGERDADEFGLRAVDRVAENPTATAEALPGVAITAVTAGAT